MNAQTQVMPTVEAAPIRLIVPSPFQKRRKFTGIEELAANIKANGLLQPVTLRPVGGPKEKTKRLELVFGERRKRACELLGMETIPAFVRDMTDAEAAVASATENLEREDLAPMEEAESVQVLLDLGWSYQEVADKTGHSTRWVARLASLTRLSMKWYNLTRDEKQPVSGWSAAHLALIARFPADVQDQVAAQFTAKQPWQCDKIAATTVDDLRRELGDLLLALSGAPWRKDDADLIRNCGACDMCAKRSDRQPELWDDEADETKKKNNKSGPVARCLDKECWNKKLAAHIKAKEAELAAAHGSVVKLTERYYADDGLTSLHKVDHAKKGDAGAAVGLVMDGPNAGQVRWVKPCERRRSTSGKVAGEKAAPKPLKERRRDYDWRRLRLIIGQLADKFEALYGSRDKPGTAEIPKHLTEVHQLSIAAAFGTKDNGIGWGWDPFKRYKGHETEPADKCAEALFRQACGVIECELRSDGNISFSCLNAKRQKEATENAQTCASLLGLDWTGLQAEAEKAIPYPKSWAKLNADGTPKAETPAAGAGKGKAKAKATAKKPAAKPKAKAKAKPKLAKKAAKTKAGNPKPVPDLDDDEYFDDEDDPDEA